MLVKEILSKNAKWFPCTVCLKPLDVRTTKRKKPYVICSNCGGQMFVREQGGIAAFERLVDEGVQTDVWTRIGQLEERYQLKCPECKKTFWASPELLGTNWFNSKASGYRCGSRTHSFVPGRHLRSI
ncbi:MAG: hypothetical protein WA510_17960 [Acidobacteriaceae bacterium]